MRISTNVIFDSGTARLGDLQSGLARTQNQISTGRRILTPADDPVAANHALELTQAQAINTQLGVNRKTARESLSLEESVLQNVTDLLTEVKSKVVAAGNAGFSDSERTFLASELSGRLEDLLGLANSRDGNGYYLFSGFQTTIQPFNKSSTGATYAGDQGQRQLQVGPTRQLELGDSGNAVFERNKTGNRTFATAAGTGNTGTGIISSGSLDTATPLVLTDYRVTFKDLNGELAYDVEDMTDPSAPVAVLSDQIYTSGQSISFNGLQFEISGTPAIGDTFTMKPSENQSIFTTLTDLISALRTSASTDAGRAALTNKLNAANDNITNAFDNVLTVRASLGARLSELDALDSEGESRNLQYAETLAELQDLDYTKAITDLSKQKIILEAAQQSFVKTSGLSLFNYIS